VSRLERALLAFLAYGAVEGAVKRVTGFSWYVYPIKDGFFLALMIAWLSDRDEEGDRERPLFALLVVYLVVVALEVFNPYLPSIMTGIVGVRGSYLYAVLYFVAYRVFRDAQAVRRFARLAGVFTVVTAVGAVVEARLGIDWVYEHRLQVMTTANYLGASGDYVLRPSSIGNGPGSAAMMEMIGGVLLLGLAVGERALGLRLAYLAGATLGFGAIILSAVRIIWLQMGLAVGVFALMLGRRAIAWSVTLPLLVGAGIGLGVLFSDGEIVARFETLETPVETIRTERFDSFLILPDVVAAFPYGAGVGWNVPRHDLVGGFDPEEAVLYFGVHNYLCILALEVGVVGLALFVLFSLRLLLRGLRVVAAMADDLRALFAGGYALFAAIALSFATGGAIIGWPGEYYWVLAALVARAPWGPPAAAAPERASSPSGARRAALGARR
jgi:hypothetical protein